MQRRLDISVVIPTYERAERLRRTLAALDAQELGGLSAELVVVDNGSRDGSRQALEAEAGSFRLPVRVLHEPKRGPAAARNTGVAAAGSPLILFLGDDTPPAGPGLLAGHVRAHSERPDVWHGVLGSSAWDPETRLTPVMEWVQRSGTFFNYGRLESEAPTAGGFYTNNISLRREAMEAADGFDERFPDAAAEDYELGFRLFELGFTLEYRPALLVHHDHHYDLAASLRRMEVAGRSINLVQRLHRGRDIETPNPGRAKVALGRAIAPLTRVTPVPRWLPRRLRDPAFRIAHRAAMVRGYFSEPLPDDPALRGGLARSRGSEAAAPRSAP